MTDDDEPLPARFGRYRVQRVLGRGAMGVVYLAQDDELQRTVAVKTVALTGDARERDLHEARFRQEARAAGGISHPSVITVYDVGREDDAAWIAMEYVDGQELRDLIHAGELTPVQAVEIAILVADGLAMAHAQGVVHRDVKPGNIMVMPDGRIKVMDFGIARLQEPTVKTQTGVLLGSPQYMSPEQVSGQPLDGRADLFSLGVVLYEMLTGHKPFDAPDLTQVLFWVVNMPARPPSERRAGLPAVLDFVVARAMRKKPEDRYANASEFARELREALPQVREAQVAMGERATLAGGMSAVTLRLVPTTASMPSPFAKAEDRLELRASRRFDSTAALARLRVMPSPDETRGGSAVAPEAAAPRRKRFDRATAILLAVWGVAALVAVAIVVV